MLSLITNGVHEQKTLDYKRELPNDSSKKEFLKDVSSFANTIGGCLIYGMREENGVPVEVNGLEGINPEKEILRLEQIIHTGIAPRLTVFTRPIQLNNGNHVLVMRIPQSYAAPHMVTLDGSSSFWARRSTGKYQLDVYELRQAFLLSDSVAQRIRDFRMERIARLEGGESPVPLENHKTKLIVHILPLSAFSTVQTLDIETIGKRYSEFFKNCHNARFNIDGFVCYLEHFDGVARQYFQIYRNGCIEFIRVLLEGKSEPNVWQSYNAEQDIVQSSYLALLAQKQFGVEPPVFIVVSIAGVKGLPFAGYNYKQGAFDRDVILLPEIMLESYPEFDDLIYQVKPILDAMWNAGGFARSDSFDKKGRLAQNAPFARP